MVDMSEVSVRAMTVQNTRTSSDVGDLPSRAARLVRVGVLLVMGMVITFSATLHEQLHFDRAMIAISLGALAVAQVFAWFGSRRGTTLLQAITAAGAAIAVLLLSTDPLAFAFLVAAWALVSGLLEFVASALQLSHRGDSIFMGALGVLLALLVLLVRDDPVAVIGFFGAYAVIGGVFLGISAFDGRVASGTDASENAPARS